MRQKEANGDGELVALINGPAIDVLEECREGLFLERFLKIFISKGDEVWKLSEMLYGCTF